MKRKALATLLVLTLSASMLTACSSKTNESSTTTEATEEATPETTLEATPIEKEEATVEATPEATPEVVTAPYETELAPGAYYVGLHIPEGIYNLEVTSGLGNMMTNSGVVSSMGSGAAASYAMTYDNLSLANGDVLKLTQSLHVKIHSDSATYSTMSSYENPATQEMELTAGSYVIGQDVPAGAYDVSVVEGALVNISLDDLSFSAGLSADPTLAESSGSTYNNLELLAGRTLQVGSGTIKLTPMPNCTPLTPQ